MILQARMGSERLPGKVLLPVLKKPLLVWQIERMKRAKNADAIVLATTTLKEDDPIAALAKPLGIDLYRGSGNNVLLRYAEAAKFSHADLVVRVTGDCPLIDPHVIDLVILEHKKSGADYTSNTRKQTFPRGMDVEVFSSKILQEAAESAHEPYDLEHVTSYIYRHPEKYSLHTVTLDPPQAEYRWTVDTQEDFTLIKNILEEIAPKNPNFTLSDLLQLLQDHPEWNKINAHIKQKPLHDSR